MSDRPAVELRARFLRRSPRYVVHIVLPRDDGLWWPLCKHTGPERIEYTYDSLRLVGGELCSHCARRSRQIEVHRPALRAPQEDPNG